MQDHKIKAVPGFHIAQGSSHANNKNHEASIKPTLTPIIKVPEGKTDVANNNGDCPTPFFGQPIEKKTNEDEDFNNAFIKLYINTRSIAQ